MHMHMHMHTRSTHSRAHPQSSFLNKDMVFGEAPPKAHIGKFTGQKQPSMVVGGSGGGSAGQNPSSADTAARAPVAGGGEFEFKFVDANMDCRKF